MMMVALVTGARFPSKIKALSLSLSVSTTRDPLHDFFPHSLRFLPPPLFFWVGATPGEARVMSGGERGQRGKETSSSKVGGAAASGASSTMLHFIDVVKQYPGQQQVDLRVEIEVPGTWFGGTSQGSLTNAEKREKYKAQAVEFSELREFGVASSRKKIRVPAIRMILMYALKTPLSAQCAGVLSTEHSVQSNPSALSALSTEMHHQNKTLSTKCCHPHGHSVLSTSTVCAPANKLRKNPL